MQAQQEMALWGLWMLIATAMTVGLTAAALVAIIGTLHHTRRAADSAEDMAIQAAAATKAAEDSVEITKAALIGIERPFIIIEILEVPKVHEDGSESPLAFCYANYGRMPAILRRDYQKVVVIDEQNALPAVIEPDDKHGRLIPNGEVVPPDGGLSEPLTGGPFIKYGKRFEGQAGEKTKVFRNNKGTAEFIGVFDAPPIRSPPKELDGIFVKPTFLIGYVIYSGIAGGDFVRGYCFKYENGRFRIAGSVAQNEAYNYDRQFRGVEA
ncbi:hypothetical protein BSQ44_20255 [Aquibium oceanicum]|uniref:Uncharacterized protein n=2 Tax=Aquibium oceanicum TaxID=1670800 RepID=A0A1L3SVR1_9HYPH|nr:hypothetical protein BSQ44_20255 [Aquibium oceanicum]